MMESIVQLDTVLVIMKNALQLIEIVRARAHADLDAYTMHVQIVIKQRSFCLQDYCEDCEDCKISYKDRPYWNFEITAGSSA